MSGIENTWEEFSNAEQVELSSRYLLTMALPRLVPDESSHSGTSWNHDFIVVDYADVESWTDFTESNLNGVFGRILSYATPWSQNLDGVFEQMNQPRLVHSEDDTDQLFLENIAPVLRHSLDCTKGILSQALQDKSVTGLQIPSEKEATKISLPQYLNDPKHFKKPNFPIYLPARSLPDRTPHKDIIFMIGESARTEILSPASFNNSHTYKAHGRIHLGKLAMYCKYGGSSLAFTMTHLGVTAFRFFEIPNGDGTFRMGAQHVFAPWVPECYDRPVPHGQDNYLSGAKAIWGLLMMSLTSEGRRLVERSQLRPINQWTPL